jgi:hypothetical protein
MPLAGLEPGKYQVTIKVNDGILKQTDRSECAVHRRAVDAIGALSQQQVSKGPFGIGQVNGIQPVFRRTRSQATQDTTAIATSTSRQPSGFPTGRYSESRRRAHEGLSAVKRVLPGLLLLIMVAGTGQMFALQTLP